MPFTLSSTLTFPFTLPKSEKTATTNRIAVTDKNYTKHYNIKRNPLPTKCNKTVGRLHASRLDSDDDLL